MKTAVTSLHKLISVNARMAGTCPAVWFAYQPSNDRGSEIKSGSREDRVK